MIKILYICVSGKGGSNYALLSTLGELKSRGIIPLIVVPDRDTAEFYEVNGFQTRVVYMRQEVLPSYKTLKSLLLFLPILLYNYVINYVANIILKKICLSFSPDIIHSNVTVTTIGYKLSKRYQIPHVWHIREYVQRSMLGKRRLSTLLNDSNTILVTKGLKDFYNIGDLYTEVIYDGINYIGDVKEERQILSDRYFVCVGRVTHAKGIDLLIDAFGLFAEKYGNVDLVLIGEGKSEYISSKKSELQNLGILDRVHFLGYKEHSVTMNYMKNALALVVPSLSEGFGLITAEAMFNGCLVIGNDNTGTKEQFDNGVTVTGREIAVRFADSEGLFKAMCEVTSLGKEHYDKMIEDAYITVNRLYTLPVNADKVCNYYKRLTKKGI